MVLDLEDSISLVASVLVVVDTLLDLMAVVPAPAPAVVVLTSTTAVHPPSQVLAVDPHQV